MKLGKLPARPGAVSFAFARYFDAAKLPTPPAVFGHEALVSSYGMLGNDQYGDCVWAGAAHETMLWAKEGGTTDTFTPASVLSDYSAVTGFNPADPASDKGTDVGVAAKYRRTTGILDAAGNRHRVMAYVAVPQTSLTSLATAAYVLGSVGLGIRFPESAMQQFTANQPWAVVPGATIEGGHYVPIVGRLASGNYVVVTWGRTQEVTPGFIQEYADEAVGYLSQEFIQASGQTLEGFDLAQLQTDLAALNSGRALS